MPRHRLTNIENSTEASPPKKALSRLKTGQEDSIFHSEEENGFLQPPLNPEFEKTMEAVRKFIKRRRNALRELAK